MKKLFTGILVLISLFFNMQISIAEQNTYLIDVRSVEEYQSGHIENALHMPYKKISELISNKVPDKNSSVILYCGSGYRAGIAMNTLKELGYTAVENGGGLKDMKKRFPAKVIAVP